MKQRVCGQTCAAPPRRTRTQPVRDGQRGPRGRRGNDLAFRAAGRPERACLVQFVRGAPPRRPRHQLRQSDEAAHARDSWRLMGSGRLSQDDLVRLRGRVLLLDIGVVLNVMLLTDSVITPSCFALLVLVLWREHVVRRVYRAGTRVLVQLGCPVPSRSLIRQSLEALTPAPPSAPQGRSSGAGDPTPILEAATPSGSRLRPGT